MASNERETAIPSSSFQAATAGQPGRGWRFWAIMISMSVSSLLVALDASAVSTAMPSIVKDLGSRQGYMWIANAYLLTMTAFTPVFGQTADIFGRRRLTILAILLFGIGSAVSAPAPTLGALIAGRALQGIGAAGLNTMVEIVVCDLVAMRERGKFMGFIFAIYGIGTSIGPMIGGVLAARATWRWVFYVNLPLALASLLLVGVSLNALPRKQAKTWHSLQRIYFGGNLVLVAAITSILLALTLGGQEQPWSSWRTIIPLVLGLLGLSLFLLIEIRVKEPTTPLRLFSNRTSLVGYVLAFTHHVLLYWVIFALPIYFQGVLGASALTSGVDILPAAIITMPFAIVSVAMLTQLGRTTTGYWAGAQIIGAAGIGLITTVTLPTILAPLSESDVAVATATWAFMRGFGTIWGAAIPLEILNSRVNQLANIRLKGTVAREALNGGAYELAPNGAIHSQYPDRKSAIKSVYVDSLKLCWHVALAFALFGLLMAFLGKEVTMRTELETEYGLNREMKQPFNQKESSENRCPDAESRNQNIEGAEAGSPTM